MCITLTHTHTHSITAVSLQVHEDVPSVAVVPHDVILQNKEVKIHGADSLCRNFYLLDKHLQT